jgi:hypothetical protein
MSQPDRFAAEEITPTEAQLRNVLNSLSTEISA